jgi:ABC-type glycerol-3-phosphate transport system substrate-binding protein
VKTVFRKAMATVLALTTTATLAACGGGGSGGDADGPVTLKVMSATVVEKPEGDVERGIADAFMKENPNIKIEFIGTPMNDIYAKLTTMATGGDLPDVFTNSPEFSSQASSLGIVEPLDDLLGADYVNGFEKVPLDQAKLDGKLQFAPFFTIPTGLLYRKDLLDKAGIKPPKTWDEFRAAARKLTVDSNGDGTPDRYGFAMVGSNNGSGGSRFIPIMRTFGATELSQQGDTWTTGFGTPEAAQAFQLYGDLVTKDKAVPPGPFQTSYAEAVALMASDKAAMMVTGPHSIGAITAQNPELEGKLAGAPLPSAPGKQTASVLGMLGFSISNKSKNKDAAAKYVEYVLNKQNQLTWNEKTGRLPVRTDAAGDPQVQRPELKGFLQAQQYAFALPKVAYYPRLQVIAAEGYQSVISGKTDGQQAATEAAAKTQTEIDQAG